MFYKRFFLAVIIVAVLLMGNIFIANRVFDNSYFGLFRPVLFFLHQKSVTAANYGRNILNTSNLASELAVLKQRNDQLLSSVSRLNDLEEENKILRTRLNLNPNTQQELIFATVFNLRGEETLTSFMINKGSNDGIKNGLAVVTAEGILAGIISKTYEHTALVLMPQNKNLTLNVKISGTSILAKARGNGHGAILEYVTSQEETKTDDIVVTSSLDNIPEAIPVFKVLDSRSVEGELFKSVAVASIFNILETSKVFVIK